MVDGVSINKTGVGDSDNLRGRDVEVMLRSVDADPKLKAVVIQIAERAHAVTKACAELATMFDQMINTMQNFSEVAENMKTRTDRLVQDTKEQERVDHDPTKTNH